MGLSRPHSWKAVAFEFLLSFLFTFKILAKSKMNQTNVIKLCSVRNLRIFVISQSVRPWQAFPA